MRGEDGFFDRPADSARNIPKGEDVAMARIFIVDDDEYIRELLSLELFDLGQEVVTAGSSSGLLDRIDRARPEVLIMEMKLARCNGVELLRSIRRRHPDLRIIVCSAYDFHCRNLRAADYFITKSCDLTALKRAIRQTLEPGIPFPVAAAV